MSKELINIKNKTLQEIAEELQKSDKKVQLIYAFNGTGKTQLSKEFKSLISPKNQDLEEGEENKPKVLYYNAFTEDLFYWDNDLKNDVDIKLKIQPNQYTNMILEVFGQEDNINHTFQQYTNGKLNANFKNAYSEVTFSIASGDDNRQENIKISKGEESNFIWCVFNSILEQIVDHLNPADNDNKDGENNGDIAIFNDLEYVFIDDPVSSLDENNVIQLAVELAGLIKSSKLKTLKFIITTHNPLFYNVLYSELKPKGYLLTKNEDNSLNLQEKKGESNAAFSYHLHIKNIIQEAINNNEVERYHFMLIRNLYEKTAAFLGYRHWTDLLNGIEGDKQSYITRIINFSSHKSFSSEEVAGPTNPEKQIVGLLLKYLENNFNFNKAEQNEKDQTNSRN